jgi:hypothetical protein
MGMAAWYLGGPARKERTFSPGHNTELAVLTGALTSVRDLARSRLRQEAARVGATGVVGVTIEQRHHGLGTVEVLVLGTAVESHAHRGMRSAPQLLIELHDADSGAKETSITADPRRHRRAARLPKLALRPGDGPTRFAPR